MSDKSVDVLAVMRKSANVAKCNAEAHPSSALLRAYAEDASEARAAVAELIDAASNVGAYTDHDSWVRLRAALARCGGQP